MVSNVTLASAGTGYTGVPTVTLFGGGGTGATATALFSGGVITGIQLTATGSGYVTAPLVVLSGGGGTGATATASVALSVTSVIVTNAGSGYTAAPTAPFSGGGATTQGTAGTVTFGSGSSILSATHTFTAADAGSQLGLTVNALITGATFGITKTGAGTFTLAPPTGSTGTAYSGVTTVNEGTMILGSFNTTPIIGGNVVVGDDIASGNYTAGNKLDIFKLGNSNQIVNTATVTINDSGLLNLNNFSNTIGTGVPNQVLFMTGGTVLTGAAGTLTLSGTGLVAVDSIASPLNGNPAKITGTVNAAGVPIANTGTLNLGGVVRTFDVQLGALSGGSPANSDLVIATAITNGGLTKQDTGTLELTGTSTYTGTTTVSSGTLLVDGTSGNIATSATTVNSGGTLGGTGTVGAVVANSGGNVSPGDGTGTIGTLTASSVNLSSGGNLNIAVQSSPTGTSSYDVLAVAGALTLGGTSTLSLNLLGFSNTSPAAITPVTVTPGSVTGTPATFNDAPAASPTILNTTSYITNNPNLYNATVLYPNSNQIQVTFQDSTPPIVTVTDNSGTYNGAGFVGTATVAGLASLESVAPTLTYYSGTSVTSGNLLTSVPSTVGTYTVLASFAGTSDGDYLPNISNPTTFSITAATPIVAVTDNSGPPNGSAFTGSDTVAGVGSQSAPSSSLEGMAPTLSYYSGSSVTSPNLLASAPSTKGTYTVLAVFSGSTDYTSASASTTFTIFSISQATPTVTVTDTSGSYNVSAFTASDTVAGVGSQSAPSSSLEGVTPTLSYYSGTSVTSTNLLTSAPSTAGTYTVLASFAGSADYTSASVSTTFSITKAVAAVAVSDPGGFTGSTTVVTETVAGIGSQSTPATSLETIPLITTYYTGSSVTGTGTTTAPSTTGTYTVVASFAGSTDYTSASASTTFTIASGILSDPSVTVSDPSGTYNTSPFVATAGGASGVTPTVTYYSGAGVGGTVLTSPPIAAGTYTVLASFAGNATYNPGNASTTFSITPATPTVAVADPTGTYNAAAFVGTDTVKGVFSQSTPSSNLEGIAPTLTYYSGTSVTSSNLLTSVPSTAGTYTVLASFVGSADYTTASANTTFTISHAAPIVAVTDSSGTYNAGTFVAIGTVAGVNNLFVTSLENAAPTLTYYSGTSVTSSNLLTSVPSTAGTYTVLASFVGSTDYTSGSASTTFSITPATPTVNVFDSSGLFNGSGFAASETVAGVNHTVVTSLENATPTLTYYSGTSVTSSNLLTSVPSTVGTYTVLASFVGSTDYTSGSANTTFTISQATPTVTVSDSGGNVTSSPATPYPATAMVAGVNHIAGTSLETVTPSLTYYSGTSVTSGNLLTSVPSTVGTYTVLASFVGSTDYTSASASTTFQIANGGTSGPIAPPLTLIDASGAYTGAAFTATTASLDGVTPSLSYYSGTSASGTASSGAPTTVGTYTVLASIAATTQYTSGTASTTFTITKALPTVSLTDNSGTFTGSAFTATTASLETVTPSLTYYSGTSVTGTGTTSAPSTAGTYTVLASFAGSTDYSTGSTSTTFTISQATPTVSVFDNSGTYTSSAFSANDTVAGVSHTAGTSLETVTPSLTYYSGTSVSGTGTTSAPTTVGTYTVLASFAGSADYTTASMSTTFSITKATATVTVSDPGGTTGSTTVVTETVVGVGSQSTPATSLETIPLITTYYSGTSVTSSNLLTSAPSTTGTYTVLASFAGSADYTSASASTTFQITSGGTGQSPNVTVTDSGGTYNTSPFVATAGGASGVTPTVTYYLGPAVGGTVLTSPPIAVGTYTVLANFAGNSTYNPGSASTTFSITPATPTVAVADPTGTYNAAAFVGTDTVKGVFSQSTPSSNLEGVAPTLTYYSGTSVTSSNLLTSVPSTAGTYTVLASFVGSTDYTTASANATFTISHAAPTVAVTDSSGTYNAGTFVATGTVAGVNSAPVGTLEATSPTLTYYSGTSVSGTGTTSAPSTVGTYTVLASFVGSTDYTSGSASTTFSITSATPTVNVFDSSGLFNGSGFAASETVAGVSHTAGTSLETVTPTVTYYSGTSVSGTGTSSAPSTVGTYTVLASFVGSADYTSGSASTTFSITSATPTVTVSDSGGIATSSPATPYPATAMVAGVSHIAGTSLETVTPSVTYYSGTSVTGTGTTSAPSTVGTYTVLASFVGSTDYTSGSASTTFQVASGPIAPPLTLIDASGAYTGAAFTATTASLDGVTPSLSYYSGTSASGTALSGAPTTVGTYTVLASIAATTQYTSGTASTTFTITKALPTVSLTDNSGTFTGSAFTATTASLETVTPSLTYYSGTSVTGTGTTSAPSTAGTYTVLASFAGSTDYSTGSTSTTFTISQATPTVSVFDNSGTYTSSAFSANDAVAGVSHIAGTSLETVTPSLTYYSGTSVSGTGATSAPSTVGTYTVLASFAGSADYTTANASTTFSITKALPTVSLTDNSGTFTGSAFTATTISLETVTPSLTYYSGTSVTGTGTTSAPSTAGTYTVLASFAGSTDYSTGSTSSTFTISQATPTVSVFDNSGTYTSSAFSANDTVAGVSHTAGTSLETVTPTVTYYSGTSVSGTGTTSAPSTVGTYTVLASFAGSADYTTASMSTTFSITKATATVTVSDPGGFTGSTTVVTETVVGVGSQSTPATSLETIPLITTYYSGTSVTSSNLLTSAPSTTGTYTVLASFAGSADYTSARREHHVSDYEWRHRSKSQCDRDGQRRDLQHVALRGDCGRRVWRDADRDLLLGSRRRRNRLDQPSDRGGHVHGIGQLRRQYNL